MCYPAIGIAGDLHFFRDQVQLSMENDIASVHRACVPVGGCYGEVVVGSSPERRTASLKNSLSRLFTL
jgi:hypothetical protein